MRSAGVEGPIALAPPASPCASPTMAHWGSCPTSESLVMGLTQPPKERCGGSRVFKV